MSHHQFSGWNSFKHCLLFRRSKNRFCSSLQVWPEGHCHKLAKVISAIIWFQQLGRKASVIFGSSDDQRTFDLRPLSQSSLVPTTWKESLCHCLLVRTCSGHVTNFRFWTTVTIFRLLLSLSVGQTGGGRGSQAHLHPVRNGILQIRMFVIFVLMFHTDR